MRPGSCRRLTAINLGAGAGRRLHVGGAWDGLGGWVKAQGVRVGWSQLWRDAVEARQRAALLLAPGAGVRCEVGTAALRHCAAAEPRAEAAHQASDSR